MQAPPAGARPDKTPQARHAPAPATPATPAPVPRSWTHWPIVRCPVHPPSSHPCGLRAANCGSVPRTPRVAQRAVAACGRAFLRSSTARRKDWRARFGSAPPGRQIQRRPTDGAHRRRSERPRRARRASAAHPRAPPPAQRPRKNPYRPWTKRSGARTHETPAPPRRFRCAPPTCPARGPRTSPAWNRR